MRILVCACLVATACEGAAGKDGVMGATGAEGAKGDMGDPGSPGMKGDKGDRGPGGVWRDSNDVLVTNAITFPGSNGQMAVVDANGYLWRVHPQTGQVTFIAQKPRVQYFTMASCAGTSYLLADPNTPALVTFEYVVGSGDVRAIPKVIAMSNQNFVSFDNGSCQATTLTTFGVQTSLVDALPTLTPPNLNGVNAPFHPALD